MMLLLFNHRILFNASNLYMLKLKGNNFTPYYLSFI